MIIAIILAFVIAKINHYSLAPLLKAYSLYPFFLVEIVFWFFQINLFMGNFTYITYASYLKSAYLYVLFLPIIMYKLFTPALFGSVCILIGTGLNKLVIYQNGGKMPVYASLSRYTGYYNEAALINSNSHIIGTETTKLKFLTDYIDVGWSILSVGDLFVHAFSLIIVFYTIKSLNREKKLKGE